MIRSACCQPMAASYSHHPSYFSAYHGTGMSKPGKKHYHPEPYGIIMPDQSNNKYTGNMWLCWVWPALRKDDGKLPSMLKHNLFTGPAFCLLCSIHLGSCPDPSLPKHQAMLCHPTWRQWELHGLGKHSREGCWLMSAPLFLSRCSAGTLWSLVS